MSALSSVTMFLGNECLQLKAIYFTNKYYISFSTAFNVQDRQGFIKDTNLCQDCFGTHKLYACN